MELEKARAIAEELKGLLEPACERIPVVAGSIRRQKPYPNDIELLCIPKYEGPCDLLNIKIQKLIFQGVLDYRLTKLGRATYGPKNKLLTHVGSGIGVDVFSTDEQCWAVALVVRTGGAATNKEIASRALERGMRFRAYGDGFDTPDGHLQCKSEQEVFLVVGLRYLEPQERR